MIKLRSSFPWELSIFPLLELVFFIGSVVMLKWSLLLAILLLLLASLSLSFGIHIFFHECVHRRPQYACLFNCVASVLMGLPFDGYRIHHYNHHAFENGAQDFSTTWKTHTESKVAYSLCTYTLGWPRQLINSVKCKTPFGSSPDGANQIKTRIPAQKIALLLTFTATLLIGWKVLLLYVTLIYVGWALTSLHNFGQHPPIENADIPSYLNVLYNRVFFNNGLHWEHHAFPELHWHELVPNNLSPKINHAHIISPLLPLLLPEIKNARSK